VATTELVKGVRATRSTIALKLLMASSGIIFILFVLVHMYGNLKAFAGRDAYDTYAEHIRTIGEPVLPHTGFLWILRVVLIVSLIVHVWSAVVLWRRAQNARTQKYQLKRNLASSLSSRTMRWGGITLLVFIVWHLLQFTIVKVNVGGGPATDKHDPYNLLVDSFAGQAWWMTVLYLIAMLALAFHLHHGTFSACQTLGWTNTASSRERARAFGWVVAIVIAGGFSLVPLFALFGVITK
jgi:succinate dehydrogenase / fumarate reductase cytochrome b subunit